MIFETISLNQSNGIASLSLNRPEQLIAINAILRDQSACERRSRGASNDSRAAMTEHRLDPLLRPRQVALLGSSERIGSPGRTLAEMIFESNFAGTVIPVDALIARKSMPC